jgi:hypothetical protein
MGIDVRSIDVLIFKMGPDKVCLYTGLPPTFPDMVDPSLVLSFDIQRGDGEAYVKKHFPSVPVNIVPTEA